MASDELKKSHFGESWRLYKERRFSVLLVVLGVVLAGPPILFGFGLSARWFDCLTSLLMLAALVSLCVERQHRIYVLLLGMPSVLLPVGGYALSGAVSTWALFVAHLCQSLFLFTAAVLIVKSLLTSRFLSFDCIFGAVCGYLLLGLAWAVAYSMIESFRPGSFEVAQSFIRTGEPVHPWPHVLTYYSFVTLTTVGYGDVIPISPSTRTFAWIEAITGQFYLAVIVAGLVSMLVARASQLNLRQSAGEKYDAAIMARH